MWRMWSRRCGLSLAAEKESNMIEQETHIRPNRTWLRVEWRELYEYRDLLWLMVRRDLVSKYKQTVLGPLWFIVQPLLTSLVFSVIFGRVAQIPTDGVPSYLFYLCGMLTWGYFSTNLTATATTFTTNAALFGKVYFPRFVIPLAATLSNLAALAIQFVTFAAFWLYFKTTNQAGFYHLDFSMCFLLPLVLVHVVALSLGVSLALSALSAKYRDFAHLLGFLTQLWLYATPVVYPLSQVPAKWRWVAWLNPLSAPTEAFRLALLGSGTVVPKGYALSVGLTVVLFMVGLLMFQRTARTFIDTV